MKEPVWLEIGRRYIGTHETIGSGTNSTIRRWLVSLKAWWTDDETPWCGVFVAQCMKDSGRQIPKHWYRALGWLEWGSPLHAPVLGCVVVYHRKGGGHVGFVVGRDRRGRLLTLGGNQDNKVSIAPFDVARVAGYRWPEGDPIPTEPLATLASNEHSSSNEA